MSLYIEIAWTRLERSEWERERDFIPNLHSTYFIRISQTVFEMIN